ncbi:MAG: Alcohol dehydrogenase zinc-binding domain protein [Glaciihabitans sp.]|nr:Alcohol dehydrogenase zinc-binding domain protein [Glaciihabitans sp.]
MRAIEYTRTGEPDVLQLVERDPRDPGPDEVRVRIAVSGVNPTDWKARAGSGDGAVLAVPQIPNQDGAGIVDAVGANITNLAVGDRVWVWDAAYARTDGTAQELAIIPAHRAVKLPANASFDEGASLGIPALTAHRALTAGDGGPDRLAPGALAGVTVLVTGGAGAVGHAAIQLAVWAGATVITTVSGEQKAELARAAGATYVINYRLEDVATRVRELAPDGVAIIVEVNPSANIAVDLDIVARGGTISIYAGTGSEALPVPLRFAMGKNVRMQFIMTYTTTPEQKDNAVQAVSAALADGALPVGEKRGLPLTRFPLERTSDAHKAVEDGTVGKALIDVADL